MLMTFNKLHQEFLNLKSVLLREVDRKVSEGGRAYRDGFSRSVYCENESLTAEISAGRLADADLGRTREACKHCIGEPGSIRTAP